jgi:PAS domain S-box-containing protein
MNTAAFFDLYYKNAEINSIVIMNSAGTILDVNQAFTNNFGYYPEELKGKNFSVLFNEEDNAKGKPQLELQTVLSKGQAHDENYILNKEGHQIWCTGEALLVVNEQGEKYIVKDIINLQAKRQLHLFLTETEELLERIFESTNDIPMLILDGSLKIQRVNNAFLQLFEIKAMPVPGSRLSDLDHPFWNSADIRNALSKIIIAGEPIKQKEFSLILRSGETRTIELNSKVIDSQVMGRKLFIIMEDVTATQLATS